MLATVEKYVKGFKDLYPLNEGGKRKEWNGALAVGRYTGWSLVLSLRIPLLVTDVLSRYSFDLSEDVYDGDGKSKANPWFIATFAVSEVAFKSVLSSSLSSHQRSCIELICSPFQSSPSQDSHPPRNHLHHPCHRRLPRLLEEILPLGRSW